MSYYFSTVLDCSFDEAIYQVIEEFKKEGFGMLPEKEKEPAKIINYIKYFK